MAPLRKTAVVRLLLPSPPGEKLPLSREREYGVFLQIDGHDYTSLPFRSPRNDEEWRTFVKLLRSSNKDRGEDAYRNATAIRSLGRDLYRTLSELNPVLAAFLRQSGEPRRLVVESKRPEIHTLPWGALIDPDARLAAEGDLSIVQAWDEFHPRDVVTTGARLSLTVDIDSDTQRSTEGILKELPPEIERKDGRDSDILHIEAHGNAATQEIGPDFARAMASKFGSPKIALLWSCYSSAANSWGESPALCLHQGNASLVLSFQAELHNDDAKSISQRFYRDVFGPAASLDPESALVRVRAEKFRGEFQFANWASMTVYLRNPLDLTAVPLNGPRVPVARWSDAAAPLEAAALAAVKALQPGVTETAPSAVLQSVPRGSFAAWKGVVIVLDGSDEPLADDVLSQLFIPTGEALPAHPADRLLWFFGRIASFTSPLVVWMNALERHRDFLRVVQPPPTLTFLHLYVPDPAPSISELVDEDELDSARKLAAGLSSSATDEDYSAAYFAYARGETFPEEAAACIGKIRSEAERSLLAGNFMSRYGRRPGESKPLSSLEKRIEEESYYRHALGLAVEEGNSRESARAKLELAYFRHAEPAVADRLYREATVDLEKASPQLRDSRWHSALGRALRDRADLLASQSGRLEEAGSLLRRAMAIHSFHGRHLQMAYSLTTAARIAFTAGRFSDAIREAMDAANVFEARTAWRGWKYPVAILLDSLAELRDATRMNAVADMAIDKAQHKTNLDSIRRDKLVEELTLKKAKALWLSGDLAAARAKLDSIRSLGANPDALRLQRFLAK